jgi:hypothetical protein
MNFAVIGRHSPKGATLSSKTNLLDGLGREIRHRVPAMIHLGITDFLYGFDTMK